MPRWARLLQRSSRWYLDKDAPSRETATNKSRKPPEPQPGVSGLHAAAAPQKKAHCRCRAQVIGSYARLIAALSWVPLSDARGLLGRCWLMGCACLSLFLGCWGLPRTVDGTSASVRHTERPRCFYERRLCAC